MFWRSWAWSERRRWLAAVLLTMIASASLWLAQRHGERVRRAQLFDNARQIQSVINAYEERNGVFPSFLAYTTELRFEKTPVNPFTERLVRLVRADERGATIIRPQAALAGHLGYYATPKAFTLFIYGKNGKIIGRLHGRRGGAI